MRHRFRGSAAMLPVVIAGALSVNVLIPGVSAQLAPAADRGPQPTASPRATAPVDLAGVWVPAITEDWRFRMVTPPRGDFASAPLNAEGRRVGSAWDAAKDIAAGEQCKAFGAPGLMRMPTRLRVSWENDTTLKVESDNGRQIRLFHFRVPGASRTHTAPNQPSWQGLSVAQWETQPDARAVPPAAAGRAGGAAPLSGSLKVVTTNLRPGYFRRNGAPYSGQAVFTEFFDRVPGPNNESWLIVTSTLDDSTYLTQPFVLTTQFKREPDDSKFSPRPCEMTPPVEGEAARGGRGRGN